MKRRFLYPFLLGPTPVLSKLLKPQGNQIRVVPFIYTTPSTRFIFTKKLIVPKYLSCGFKNYKIWFSKFYVKNHLNLTDFLSCNTLNFGAHLLLLTFFDNLNFQKAVFSEIMSNFWRHCTISTWKTLQKYFGMFNLLVQINLVLNVQPETPQT